MFITFQTLKFIFATPIYKLSENCSLRDVAYVKLHTSTYRRDNALDGVKQEAAAFFGSLDKQPSAHSSNARDFMASYQTFLLSVKETGISTKTELLEYLKKEDRYFRTFLLHLDECSEVGASAVTQLNADITASIYKPASEPRIPTEDILVYMDMRTARRILNNAQMCVDQIKEGKVKTPSSANAYLWMVLQPYLSMDSFAISLLDATQSKQMMDIAEAYPTLIQTLSAQGLYEAKQSELIPTQLMRFGGDEANLAILYHIVPDRKKVQTDFGQKCCAYFYPSLEQMYKLNCQTDTDGLVRHIDVTVYDSLEDMVVEVRKDLHKNEDKGAVFLTRRLDAQIMNDFSVHR